MIGYSLSLCVRDIIAGKVPLEKVERIIASTAAQAPQQWNMLIVNYSRIYWKADPERARSIVQQLRDEGRIEQPRLADPGYSRSIAGGHWEG